MWEGRRGGVFCLSRISGADHLLEAGGGRKERRQMRPAERDPCQGQTMIYFCSPLDARRFVRKCKSNLHNFGDAAKSVTIQSQTSERDWAMAVWEPSGHFCGLRFEERRRRRRRLREDDGNRL